MANYLGVVINTNYLAAFINPIICFFSLGIFSWIVRAEVYKADSEKPSGVGHAFELDGTGMANKTSALENAETSAVGRALAQAGYSGSRRTTREEMAKVLIPELREQLAKATTKDATRAVWNEAQKNGVLDTLRQEILDRNEVISNNTA